MHILRSVKKLDWGDLSLPVWGLDTDWFGVKRGKPLMYSLAEDESHLWFVAAAATPARLHGQARPGVFCSDLWQQDVAECFIADAASGRYMEFHLAANGAWWSGEFVQPRVKATAEDVAFPEVETFAELSSDGGWMAAMAIPKDLLQARVGYGDGSLVNVCFMADAPERLYYSAAKLPGEMPNFHQPGKFPLVTFTDWADEAE